MLPCVLPELNRGWCQYARVQRRGCAARSVRSHCSCAEPALMETSLLSATTCQAPRSNTVPGVASRMAAVASSPLELHEATVPAPTSVAVAAGVDTVTDLAPTPDAPSRSVTVTRTE